MSPALLAIIVFIVVAAVAFALAWVVNQRSAQAGGRDGFDERSVSSAGPGSAVSGFQRNYVAAAGGADAAAGGAGGGTEF